MAQTVPLTSDIHHATPASLSSPRWQYALSGIICVCLLAVHCWLYLNAHLDDAYISYRYSENFANGHGLVWNIGEPPVEGYTNFLWTVLNGIAIKLNIHPLAASKIMGCLAAFGFVALAFSPLNVVATKLASLTTFGLLIAFCPLIAFYSQSGMESTLFAALIFGGALATSKSVIESSNRMGIVAAIFFGIAATCRPEGVAFWGLALFASAIYIPREARVPRLAALALPMLLIWAPYYIWRFQYYGFPFPNTYYAKHSGGDINQWATGVLYLSDVLARYLGAPLALLLGVVFWSIRVPMAKASTRQIFYPFYVGLTSIFYALYIVKVGGDDAAAFPSLRLALPMVPLLFLGVGWALDQIAEMKHRWVIALLTLAIVTAPAVSESHTLIKYTHASLRSEATAADVLRKSLTFQPGLYNEPRLASWIRERRPKLVALPWAGIVPYYARVPVLDTLGLNDLHIAHQPRAKQRGVNTRMDPSYVMDRRPDLVFIQVKRSYAEGKSSFREAGGWKLGDAEMLKLLMNSPDYELIMDAPTDICVFGLVSESISTEKMNQP